MAHPLSQFGDPEVFTFAAPLSFSLLVKLVARRSHSPFAGPTTSSSDTGQSSYLPTPYIRVFDLPTSSAMWIAFSSSTPLSIAPSHYPQTPGNSKLLIRNSKNKFQMPETMDSSPPRLATNPNSGPEPEPLGVLGSKLTPIHSRYPVWRPRVLDPPGYPSFCFLYYGDRNLGVMLQQYPSLQGCSQNETGSYCQGN